MSTAFACPSVVSTSRQGRTNHRPKTFPQLMWAHIIDTGTESYRFRRTIEGRQKKKAS